VAWWGTVLAWLKGWGKYVVLAVVALIPVAGWALERRAHKRTKHERDAWKQNAEDHGVRADAAEERLTTNDKVEAEYEEEIAKLREEVHGRLLELEEQGEDVEEMRKEIDDAAGDTEATLAALRRALDRD
jgi:uncharacterized protein HemX